jgi:predicted Zn-dependent peptidase
MRSHRSLLAAACVAGTVLAAGAPGAVLAADLVPACTRTVLPNGLVLLLLEQHEIPVVNFELVLRTGSLADPPGKEGLANATFELMRKGTATLRAEQLAEELDFLGAQLDFAAGVERSSVSAQFLAKDVDRGLALLADLVLHPKFDPAEVRKLVDLQIDALRDLKDTPRQVVANYYDGFLFAGHPFGRPGRGTETSLPGITPEDVRGFYDRHLRADRAILAVAGDFAAADMGRKLESAFGAWPQGGAEVEKAPAPKPVKGRRVLVVDKPDATQTYFRFGNVGVAKGDPDEAALEVVNTVFGGRFTSWLMTELRTKSGLSYNAHSNFVRRRVPGAFYVSSFTRTDDTGKALDLALELLGKLHSQGLTEAEIVSAQNYIRGQYPPEYESPGQLASALAELEFFGLDRAYINDFTKRTDTVRPADAKRVIAARYPVRDLAFVLVGQASKIKGAAAKYGTVSEKSISAPGF